MGKLTNTDWWLGRTDAQKATKAARQERFEARMAKSKEKDAERRAKIAALNGGKTAAQRAAQSKADHAFDASFEDYKIKGREFRKGFSSWPIGGAKADFEHGANVGSRVTATRVVLTGVFALALKKNKNRVYVVVQLSTGEQFVIDSAAKNEKDAREFAAKINQAGQHWS